MLVQTSEYHARLAQENRVFYRFSVGGFPLYHDYTPNRPGPRPDAFYGPVSSVDAQLAAKPPPHNELAEFCAPYDLYP